MEIRLLNKDYLKSEEAYEDFLLGKIKERDDIFTERYIKVSDETDFPIYMGKDNDSEREENFVKAFKTLKNIMANLRREEYMDKDFWYSYFLLEKRDYILEKYPKVQESIKEFKNIVLKKFDWESYVYKLVLAVEYIVDFVEDENEQERYCRLISRNLDIYNYIIKYSIFRNNEFLIKILDIIDENDLSSICKKKIKYYKSDERFGRKVIFEMNKSYPIILSPMMDKESLKELFVKNLEMYLELDGIEI